MLVSASGERLPFTRISVGSRTMEFFGRPGPRLVGAVEHLQRHVEHLERHEETVRQQQALRPLDVRD